MFDPPTHSTQKAPVAGGLGLLTSLLAGEIRGNTALHLFSGPASRDDGLAAALRGHGWNCIDFDSVNSVDDDLANDEVWERIFEAIRRGLIQFVWMGPPCTSFSPARRHQPGPRAVRDAANPRGLPRQHLTQAEVEQVRLANYFVVQCGRAAVLAHECKVGFAIENPTPWNDPRCASMFDFQEIAGLRELPGVEFLDFDQCTMGAGSAKPTRIVYCGIQISGWSRQCDHRPRYHWCEYKDASGHPVGEWQWGAHPKMVRSRGLDGSWASKAAAAYPSDMNKAIAQAIKDATAKPQQLERKKVVLTARRK